MHISSVLKRTDRQTIYLIALLQSMYDAKSMSHETHGMQMKSVNMQNWYDIDHNKKKKTKQNSLEHITFGINEREN